MTARCRTPRGALLILGVLALAGCPSPREVPPPQRADKSPLPEGLPPFPEPERMPLDDLGTNPEASMAVIRYLDELCGMLRKDRAPVAEVVRHLGRMTDHKRVGMAVKLKPHNPVFRHGEVVESGFRPAHDHDVFYVELELADPNTLTLAALRRVFGPVKWTGLLGVHGGPDKFRFYDERRPEGPGFRCDLRAITDIDSRLVTEAMEAVDAEYGTPAEPKKPSLTIRQWQQLIGERLNARVTTITLFREGMSEEPRPKKR